MKNAWQAWNSRTGSKALSQSWKFISPKLQMTSAGQLSLVPRYWNNSNKIICELFVQKSSRSFLFTLDVVLKRGLGSVKLFVSLDKSDKLFFWFFSKFFVNFLNLVFDPKDYVLLKKALSGVLNFLPFFSKYWKMNPKRWVQFAFIKKANKLGLRSCAQTCS